MPDAGTARAACERLMEHGILAKDTHEHDDPARAAAHVEREDLEWALERIEGVLAASSS